MLVKKRSGQLEEASLDKLTKQVQRFSKGLEVEPIEVAKKAAAGLHDMIETKKIDEMLIHTSALMTGGEPDYSRLASRLLGSVIDKEVRGQKIHSFLDCVRSAHELGLLSADTLHFVEKNHLKLTQALDHSRNDLFEYFGLRTVYDRYLLKHPKSREVIESPQYFFMRVACGISNTAKEAIELYEILSSHEAMCSTPTLFNSGTPRSQMSSCYLIDSPQDDLSHIFRTYSDIAQLSKWAGGIGLSYSRVRAKGSLIKGTNGFSNGIVPWLKILDAEMGAVNQGGRRKGSACVYLESWHADIEQFLELRDNTGDHEQRAHNLNLANWIPDLFMKRVKAGEMWSLFDPKDTPDLVDLWGDNFEQAYLKYEAAGVARKQISARDLYARMMKTLAQTGNGWMNFKDASNAKSNQTLLPGNAIHSSNLCTEILEITNEKETAVCNLGSLNLSKFVRGESIDFHKLAKTAKGLTKVLNRVIDKNFYPTDNSSNSNKQWRPVGLGVMGLQDVFFMLQIPFDSARAKELTREIQEVIYLSALQASVEMAEKEGAHPTFDQTRASQGLLQHDLWGVEPKNKEAFEKVKEKIREHGLRNSLLIAIAPTATIASIVGCYECIEPQVSNLFKRETLSGEFLQVNRYLVQELKTRGLWTEEVRNQIKLSEGSIQGVASIPEEIRVLYRTAWELSQKDLIELAVARAPFIDQSQSLNLFMESPNIGKLSSMYMYAWERGLKTTYYLRSRPATKIAKATVSSESAAEKPKATDEEAVVCSLENPEACESCQ